MSQTGRRERWEKIVVHTSVAKEARAHFREYAEPLCANTRFGSEDALEYFSTPLRVSNTGGIKEVVDN